MDSKNELKQIFLFQPNYMKLLNFIAGMVGGGKGNTNKNIV